jgi:hypothetical protein
VTHEEAVGRLTALVVRTEVARLQLARLAEGAPMALAPELLAGLREVAEGLRAATDAATERAGVGPSLEGGPATVGAVPPLSAAPRWPVTTPAPLTGKVRGTPVSVRAGGRAGNGSGDPRCPHPAPDGPGRQERYLALVADDLRGRAGRAAVVLWADRGRWARALGWLKAQTELEVAARNAAVRAERRRWALRGPGAREEWRAAEAAHRAWRSERLAFAAAAEARIRALREAGEEKAGPEARTG